MIEPTSCPEPDALKALLEGVVSPAEEAPLSDHLEQCPRCQEALLNLTASGDSWAGVARSLGQQPEPAESALREALARIAAAPTHSTDTQADVPRAGELALDFLDPPTDPGHLGRLDRYDVLGVIGRGGMGVVLRAFDPTLERIVAIKVLAPQLACQDTSRKRFLREARAAAKVNHDNVVTIHEVSEVKGLPYLVMEFVPGSSLAGWLASGPMPTTEVLRIAIPTARGLAAAHAQGLVHRDVKPANILLEERSGRVKLTDFGLARAADDASVTQSGVVAGTPQFMAPEQARGEPFDQRADLFSLGSVLYAMCSGRAPFDGGTPLAVMRRVSDEVPPPITEVNPSVQRWLAGIITKLHARSPADRFQSAGEVADLLERHQAQLQRSAAVPVAAPLATPVRPVPAPRTRSRRPVLVAAVAALLLAGFGVSAYEFGLPPFRRAPAPKAPDTDKKEVRPTPVPDKPSPKPVVVVAEPPAPVIPPIPEPKLAGRVEVKLSEPFAQVRTGGVGRYLIFHLKKAQKLAVFDVSKSKVAHEIDAPDDVLYAAGVDKLFVVVPAQRLLQRWDLHTGRREKTVPFAEASSTRAALMGCNAWNPLLLFYAGKFVPWDAERMEPSGADVTGLGGDPKYNFQARISADGRSLTVWHGGLSGQQYGLVRLRRPKNTFARSPDAHSFNERWAMPSADGSMVFRFGSAIYDDQMRPLGTGSVKGVALLPTEDPRFFLAVQEETRDTNKVLICTSADRQVIFAVNGVEKMTGSSLNSRWGQVNGEPRVHYLPTANVFVNLPERNDRVVLRPLNLFDALNRSGKDYLFVLSRPKPRIAPGADFAYHLDVRSKAGGLKFELEAGPEGMTVSDAGVVRWAVPKDFAGRTVRVIVTIRGASGKEVQHSFELNVVGPGAPK